MLRGMHKFIRRTLMYLDDPLHCRISQVVFAAFHSAVTIMATVGSGLRTEAKNKQIPRFLLPVQGKLAYYPLRELKRKL